MLLMLQRPQAENEEPLDLQGMPQSLQTVVRTHAEVFGKPQGIPPARNIDIEADPGEKPVRLWPHRYSHAQKEELG